MIFTDSNHMQKRKLIRRTIFSGMNLLLIASFIAAPTSIVLLPSLSFAVAPIPAPTDLEAAILSDLDRVGQLSGIDIANLKEAGKGKNGYVTVRSIVNRINHYLALRNSPFRLVSTAVLVLDSKVGLTVTLVNIKTKRTIEKIEFDLLNYEEPIENTSVPAPVGPEGT